MLLGGNSFPTYYFITSKFIVIINTICPPAREYRMHYGSISMMEIVSISYLRYDISKKTKSTAKRSIENEISSEYYLGQFGSKICLQFSIK